MHLRRIQELVAARFRWDADSYPSLESVRRHEDVRSFQRHHLLDHLLKSIGRLASASERADHGHRLAAEDPELITGAVAKLVADALHFAGTQGVSAAQIEARILREFSEAPNGLRCRSWSGACAPRVDTYVIALGTAPMCSYHASVAEDVHREQGVPLTVAHHDALYVDQTDSG